MAAQGSGAARLVVVPDAEALARATAEEVARRAEAAVAARGAFTIALSGGSTPQRFHALLADPAAPYRARIAWDRTVVLFGDERAVPPDHPDSNYGMARDALLAHVPAAAVLRMEGERPAAEAADRYEARLRERFGAGAPPRLDVILLGIGPDGHTASLFPGNPALEERARWVAAPFVPHLGAHRITLTFPVLDAAAAVIFQVAGADKAGPLRALLAPGPPAIPAARVRPAAGELLVLADAAAAGS